MEVIAKYKAIVLVTDGDNLEGDPTELARKAQKKGIRIYTIGIGTKEGELIQRAGWNGKEMFLFLVDGSRFEVNRAPLLGIFPEGTVIDYHAHIDMKTATGEIVPWLASQSDLLADDWQVYIR